MNKILFAVTLLGVLIVPDTLGVGAMEQKASPPVSITLTAPSAPVKAAVHVILPLTITNGTKEILKLASLAYIASYEIEVRGEDGHLAPETEQGCKMHPSSKCNADNPGYAGQALDSTIVRAGESITMPLDVSQEYQLTPGRYQIQVTQRHLELIAAPADADLALPDKYPSTKIDAVRSNVVKVDVIP